VLGNGPSGSPWAGGTGTGVAVAPNGPSVAAAAALNARPDAVTADAAKKSVCPCSLLCPPDSVQGVWKRALFCRPINVGDKVPLAAVRPFDDRTICTSSS
jgi:hypothetical protein